MKRIAVGFGIDGDRLNPHAAGGLEAAAGDLAAICDQNSFEHVLVCLGRPWGSGNLAWRAGGNNSVVQQNATEATVYVHPAQGLRPRLPNIFSRNSYEIFRARTRA